MRRLLIPTTRINNMQSNNNQQENHKHEHAQIPAEERNDEQYQNSSGEGRPTSIAQDEFLFQHPVDTVWEAH